MNLYEAERLLRVGRRMTNLLLRMFDRRKRYTPARVSSRNGYSRDRHG